MNRRRKKKAGNEQQHWSVNLDVVHPNAAGIDIGNESHYVAVPRIEMRSQCGSLPASRRPCSRWQLG